MAAKKKKDTIKKVEKTVGEQIEDALKADYEANIKALEKLK